MGDKPRTNETSLAWSIGKKPAGSPSEEMPLDSPVYISLFLGVTEYFLNVEGPGSGGNKYNASVTTEDRIESSIVYLEHVEKRDAIHDGDTKIWFRDRIRIKSLHEGVETYLNMSGTPGDGNKYEIGFTTEKECKGDTNVWRFKHGTDMMESGLAAVGMEQLPLRPI